MSSIWDLLLEGAGSADADTETPEVDEEIEKKVAESVLPIDVMIESIFTDAATEVNAAFETYEMACIVGGLKVVSEGMDQDGAKDVLTEAAGNLWNSLVAAVNKLRDSVISAIRKVIVSAESIGKNIKPNFDKIEAEFDKNFEDGKFKYKGYIVNPASFNAVDTAVNGSKSLLGMDEFEKGGDGNGNYNDKAGATDEGDPTKKVIKLFVDNTDGLSSKAESQKDLINDIKTFFGCGGDAAEVAVSKSDVDVMKAIISGCTKEAFKAEKKFIADINDITKRMVKDLKAGIKEVDSESTKASWSRWVATLQAYAHIITAVINLKIKVKYSAANSYLGWMTTVAKGKGVTESVEESFSMDDFNLLDAVFEGMAVEEFVEPVEEFTAFANLKAVKIWFGDNGKALRDAIKDANKKYAEKDFKGAQNSYEEAKKNAQAAVAQLKNIDASTWTSVLGFVLFGWYYVNWRLLAHLIVKITEPPASAVKLSKEDKDALKKECGKDFKGTQKVIARILNESIVVCDKMIDMCKNPEKANMEGLELDDTIAGDVMEAIESMLDLMESDDCEKEEPDDPDGDEPSEEGTDLLDMAMSFVN